MKTIILGGGCFWCIEAVYQRIKGVKSVTSGYAGDDSSLEPTYENHGDHAEVVKIEYDESIIPLDTILEIFFSAHDPTTVDRQGNDVGRAYRSIIIHAPEETEPVRAAINDAQLHWDDPIVTETQTNSDFYVAEDYHQNYYNQNQNAGYCQIVINPKLDKVQDKFKHLLK